MKGTELNAMSCREIVETCSGIKDISVKNRELPYVIARSVYCYLAVRLNKCGTALTGRVINKDHSTVVHSMKKIESVYKPHYDEFNVLLKDSMYLFKEIYGDPRKVQKERNKDVLILKQRQKIRMLQSELIEEKKQFTDFKSGLQNPIYSSLSKLTDEQRNNFMNYRLIPFLKMENIIHKNTKNCKIKTA